MTVLNKHQTNYWINQLKEKKKKKKKQIWLHAN